MLILGFLNGRAHGKIFKTWPFYNFHNPERCILMTKLSKEFWPHGFLGACNITKSQIDKKNFLRMLHTMSMKIGK